MKNKYHSTVAGYLVFVAAAYFGGVGLGMFLESGDHGSHDSHAAHHEATHGEHSAPLAKLNATPEEAALLERLALDKTNTGVANAVQVSELQSSMPSEVVEGTTSTSGLLATSSTDTINKNSQNQLAATFFGIYYCMTACMRSTSSQVSACWYGCCSVRFARTSAASISVRWTMWVSTGTWST